MLPAFGPGSLLVRRTDIAGQTPVNIGYANEFALEQAFTTKDLYGQNDLPLLRAHGTRKVTAKAKSALISALAFNSVFFGATLAGGQNTVALTESHTITTAGTTTIAPPASGTFKRDLGVMNAATGLPLQVHATPSTLQYSVVESTGVYTWAAADIGKTVLITYLYNVAAVGQNLLIASKLIGSTPTFEAWYYTAVSQPGGAVPLTIELYSCTADKLNMQFKLEDFMLPEFDFGCAANAAGNLGQLNFGEVS
jgi:hypothetical protein